jgi:simple sugar transport system substrate-binding protein
MKNRRWVIALFALLALMAAACTTSGDGAAESTEGGGAAAAGSEGGGGGVAQRDLRFVVVTHGQSSDPFWSVVANGVQDGADDMGVQVEYQAPGTFDMVEMSNLIDAAVASNPDGLVVSIPDADALGPSIEAAAAADIPVISINSGSDVFKDLGVLTHVGQTEFEAGLGAGEKLAEAGGSNAICVNQEVGNVALDQRCDGFTEGFGGNVEVIPGDLNDPQSTQSTIESTVGGGGIDTILTLGPTAAVPTLQALQGANQLENVSFATFDLSPEVLQAIADGQMAFAIDQQQYLQGYLPIVFLTKFKETLAVPGGGGVVLTGPGFVEQDTAADVIDLSSQGVR